MIRMYGWEKKQQMKHILFVEDHSSFRQALTNVLGRESDLGEVSQAGTLAEVRELGLLGEIDLAIVDLALPDGDGLDLIGGLRAAIPHVPVLVLTISVDPDSRSRAMEAGADEVLSKAAPLSEIIEAIRRLGG
jgi:DNA-binding NarL/FixJ family response regulator